MEVRRMRRSKSIAVLALTLAPLLLSGGCAKKATRGNTASTAESESAREPVESAGGREGASKSDSVEPIRERIPESVNIGAETGSAAGAGTAAGALETVYFDYDSTDLGETSRASLRNNADWLQAHPKARVEIAGHCDDRGTIDYNLALGDRRAGAVRAYLAGLGIDASRMTTVSYGEERPAAPGSDEEARSKNRRAEFLLLP
jgi:peptidoglycan-associated lipoprotein